MPSNEHATRYFNPAYKEIAAQIYAEAKDLPLICPHGHVDPRLFAQKDYQFGSPVELLIIPDHYIFRMLYSQGIPLEDLGIPSKDGSPVEQDHRKIWQIVADHWVLFNATPTGNWMRDELADVFGITDPLNGSTAQAIYDQIATTLQMPEFNPRSLYDQFKIEVLATTDAATDTLAHHQAILDSGWAGRIVPTFRPDAVVNIDMDGWQDNIQQLSSVSGIDVQDYHSFIKALEQRRGFFKSMGATATDHAALTAYTDVLSQAEAETIFQRALKGEANGEDATRFTGHLLIEMARMSSEDGLTMQLHIGSYRNHNPQLLQRFGRDMGADIPIRTEFTRNLKPLLDRFGNQREMRIVLFNLDETTYSRELAPLAGHYPALRLGPPWWFFDSWYGMKRYLDLVVETAGIYNTAGFNDDTRAFLSIPARHEMWRRVCADWLAEQLVRRFIREEEAASMMRAMAYDLAKDTYRLG